MFHYQKIKILQLSVFAVIIKTESDRGLAGSGPSKPIKYGADCIVIHLINGVFVPFLPDLWSGVRCYIIGLFQRQRGIYLMF